MTDTEAIQCGVCGELLNHYNGKPAHAAELTGTIDHPTIPVPFNPKNARYKCDFCGDVYDDLTTAHTLPASDFADPILPNAWSRGGWCICPICAVILKDDDWDEIFERTINGLHVKIEHEPEVRHWLRLRNQRLREHITGPLREYEPGDEQPA